MGLKRKWFIECDRCSCEEEYEGSETEYGMIARDLNGLGWTIAQGEVVCDDCGEEEDE